jgi:hypothetical protein
VAPLDFTVKENFLHKPNLNTRGGVDILLSRFSDIGLWDFIDKAMGSRCPRAEYSNGEIIRTWALNLLSGSKRLEHSIEQQGSFKHHPKMQKGMSPDTISRVCRRLAIDNSYYTKKRPRENNRLVTAPTDRQKAALYEINSNFGLNCLLLDTAIMLGLFKEGHAYPLDIDATIIESKVSDCRTHYQQDGKGYCPMVVMLDGIPIFIEMRNGNCTPILRKKDVLEQAIDLIEGRGLKISFVRIDSAGSSRKVLNYLLDRGTDFCIRAHGLYQKKNNPNDDPSPWADVPNNGKLETREKMVLFEAHPVRLVEYKRYMRAEGKVKIFGIYTSDFVSDAENIITKYNRRGKIEQRFSELKEMGWRYMVHRELKFNTVHVMISMLALILFIYTKRWLVTKMPQIRDSLKPRKFRKLFIYVVTAWIDGKLKFFTKQKQFEPAFGFP